MATRLLEQPDAIIDRTGFGVFGAIIKATDMGVRDGPGAHGARLQRDVKIAAIKPPGATRGKCGPNRQHFGVGSGIAQFAHAIGRGGNDLPIFHNYRTNRCLAIFGGGGSKLEGGFHWAVGVVHG